MKLVEWSDELINYKKLVENVKVECTFYGEVLENLDVSTSSSSIEETSKIRVTVVCALLNFLFVY